MNLSDIEPAFDDQFTSMMPASVLRSPAVTQAMIAAGQKAPVLEQQAAQAQKGPQAQQPSLRDIYAASKAEALEKNPEEDRKPFKWSDLSDDQKKDLMLRFGLSLMTNAPGSTGFGAFGKAGMDALSHFDAMKEANREDAEGRRKEARNEGGTLAELAGLDRRMDQADRQVLPGAGGYAVANTATGAATPVTGPDGQPVLPSSSGANSVFDRQYRLWLDIAKDRGMKPAEAKEYAMTQASNDNVDPSDYVRARGQVIDLLMPNGRPSRQMRDMMERTGKTSQEIIDEQTEQVLSRFQNSYGLSDFSGGGEPVNPFIIPQ